MTRADDPTEAERRVRDRIGDQPFDFEAMSCVANLYRAATAFRNRVERELLAPFELSWSGFTTLYVLWVWGPSHANQLATDVGVSLPTLTGIVTTLQRRGLVGRQPSESDRRKTVVALTEEGRALIEVVFPRFHAYEVNATGAIAADDQRVLSAALRSIIRWADDTTEAAPAEPPTALPDPQPIAVEAAPVVDT